MLNFYGNRSPCRLEDPHNTARPICLEYIINILLCLTFFVNSSVSSSDCPLFHHSVEVEAQIPLRLREGDIIIMGTTELMVHVTNLEDLENFPPEDLVQQN